MLDDLSKYGIEYPELCVDIVNYFRNDQIHSMLYEQIKLRLGDGLAAKTAKSTLDFAQYYKTKYKELNGQDVMLQPKTISKICNRLCNIGVLSRIHITGFNTLFGDEYYYEMPHNIPNTIANQKFLNYRVYGFKYIYESYKNNVLPINVYNKESKIHQTGTCFKTNIGIVTAAYHCLENQDYAQIPNISADILNKSQILTSPEIDLLLIIPPREDYNFDDYIEVGIGEIIDEIMVMGYPNHAGFEKFLTLSN